MEITDATTVRSRSYPPVNCQLITLDLLTTVENKFDCLISVSYGGEWDPRVRRVIHHVNVGGCSSLLLSSKWSVVHEINNRERALGMYSLCYFDDWRDFVESNISDN